jgi:hypothetical protein
MASTTPQVGPSSKFNRHCGDPELCSGRAWTPGPQGKPAMGAPTKARSSSALSGSARRKIDSASRTPEEQLLDLARSRSSELPSRVVHPLLNRRASGFHPEDFALGDLIASKQQSVALPGQPSASLRSALLCLPTRQKRAKCAKSHADAVTQAGWQRPMLILLRARYVQPTSTGTRLLP